MQEVIVKEELIENSIDGDLLNRQEFVDQVKNIIEIMAAQKKNSCFAINGGWGIGKSFVLNALEQQLSDVQDEKSATDKYLIFHYNCWQYDYYEEPLVAMVASILDAIEEKTHLIPEEHKAKFKGVLKAIGNGLLHKASEFVQEKTGVNAEEIIDVLKEGNKDAAKKIEENNAYDANFIFKKEIISLQKEMCELSKDQTIIFVVDELDRCLPQYSIRVLERLHHVFYGIPNVQVVMSIDKAQLTHTIKQIYGKETDVKKYLAKFIRFEINLDNGNINILFDEKFSYYVSQFNYTMNSCSTPTDIQEIRFNLLKGIDIRNCIETIEKCTLLHEILVTVEETKTVEYMCVELFLALLKYYGINTESSHTQSTVPCGLRDFLEELQSSYTKKYVSLYMGSLKTIVDCQDIYGILLACYRKFSLKHDDWKSGNSQDILNYATDFWNLLQIVN